MNDPLLVRGFEGVGNLSRDRERLAERDRALRAATDSGRTFIATERFRFVSVAR